MMKHYLKIENQKIVEAPYKVNRNGFWVYGYNQQSNEKMLIADGYTAYTFSAMHYEIKDGAIVQKEIPEVEKTVFSKLEIRRACRTLCLQEKLNTLLASSAIFSADWADAQQIDLNDDTFIEALKMGTFTEWEINAIKDVLK